MSDDDFVDRLIDDREGGFSDDPLDGGGATKFGVTAVELGRWRRLGRQATRDEVAALERTEARAIYYAWYLQPFAWVGDSPLRQQLVDFSVLSGSVAAITALQRVLGVDVDGLAGPRTKAALVAHDPHLVNNALVAARCRLLSAIVDRRPDQLHFFHGWIRRAVGFYA